MNISFFDSGKSDGKSPVNYVLNETDHKGDAREVAPKVLAGDPADIIKEIDSISRKNKYKSFSINFRKDEVPNEKAKIQVIDEVLTALCSGLKKEQYKYLAVDHGDHIHIVMPMKEMTTGRAFNIKPPGETTHEFLRATQALINHKHGWGQVVEKENKFKKTKAEFKIESILKAKGVKFRKSNGSLKSTDDLHTLMHNLKNSDRNLIGRSLRRELIHEIFLEKCSSTERPIFTRSDLISAIQKMNIVVSRASEKSITLNIYGQKIKFEGGIYAKNARIREIIESENLNSKFDYHKEFATAKRIYESRAKYFAKAFAPALSKEQKSLEMRIRKNVKSSFLRHGLIFYSKLSAGGKNVINFANKIDNSRNYKYTGIGGGVVNTTESNSFITLHPKLRDQSPPLSKSATTSRIDEIRAKINSPPVANSPPKIQDSARINTNSSAQSRSASSNAGPSQIIGSLRTQLAELQAKLATANTFEAAKIHFQIFQIKKKLEEIIAKMKKKQDEENASSYSRPKGP